MNSGQVQTQIPMDLLESDRCHPGDAILVQATPRMEKYHGDLTGFCLGTDLVQQGRLEEMKRIEQMEVGKHILRMEPMDLEIHFVGVRWVNANQGTLDSFQL